MTGEGERGSKIAAFRKDFGTEKTASFFRTADELATLVLAAIMRSGLAERPYTVPPHPTGFVARPNLTQALIKVLLGEGAQAIGANTLVQGPGGFGKTALVIDVCHHPEIVSAFPDGILWTVLGKEPNLAGTLRYLHVSIVGSAPAVEGHEAIGQALAKALEGRRYLVVVDDVWHPEDLKPFLELTFPRLLVTSRIGNLLEQMGQVGWEVVPVDEMQPFEAAALLERGLPLDDADRQTLLKVADRLGCWPLLLELANARLLEEHKNRHGDVSASISRVVTLFEQRGVLSFDRRDSNARNGAVRNSIKAGLEFANDLFPGVAQKAAEISIFPEDIAIPALVLADLWKMAEIDLEEDVLRILANLSILRWDRQDDTVYLHDLVRLALETFLGGNTVPVHQRLLEAWTDPQRLPHRYAWLWICWHLREADRQEEIRKLLLNLSWLKAKIRQVGLIPLLQDMDLVPNDNDVAQVKGALLLSTSIVSGQPELLPQQLESRLAPPVWERLDRSGAAEKTTRKLRSLITTLAQVGGPIARLFSLGDRIVTDVAKLNTRQLLLACEEGLLTLDLENGDVASFCETVGAPSTIAVSDDGRLVAYVLKGSPEIHVLSEGIKTHTLLGHEGKVRFIVLCGDGKTLVSTGDNGTIRFWDTSTGTERQSLPPLKARLCHVCAILCTNLVGIVEYGTGSKAPALARLVELERFLEIGVVELPFDSIGQVTASNSGRMLACVSLSIHKLAPGYSFAIALVDVKNRRLHDVLIAGSGETVNVISCIAFSVNDRFLLAGTMKGELLVWDIESKRLALRIDAHHNHTAFVTELAARVVTVGWTQSYSWGDQGKSEFNVKVWAGDINMLTKVAPSLKTVERHQSEVSAIAISEDDSEVVTGSYDETVALWDVEGIKRKRTCGIRGAVQAVSLNKKANVYAALGNYAIDCCVVNVWSIFTGDLLYEIETDDLGESVAFTPSGKHILIGMAMTLAVHATSDGARTRSITLSNWDTESFHTGNLCCISEVLVAVGTESGVIRIWDYESGEKTLEVKAHDSAIVGLFIADEQRLMISLSSDGQIRLWNGRSGTPIRTLATAHLNIVAGAVSTKAPFLLTAGRDGTARVWDLGSGREVASFAVDSPLKSCAISSDGARVFLGDMSGRVHFLQLEECRNALPHRPSQF